MNHLLWEVSGPRFEQQQENSNTKGILTREGCRIHVICGTLLFSIHHSSLLLFGRLKSVSS